MNGLWWKILLKFEWCFRIRWLLSSVHDSLPVTGRAPQRGPWFAKLQCTDDYVKAQYVQFFCVPLKMATLSNFGMENDYHPMDFGTSDAQIFGGSDGNGHHQAQVGGPRNTVNPWGWDAQKSPPSLCGPPQKGPPLVSRHRSYIGRPSCRVGLKKGCSF